MYEPHQFLISPSPGAILWRYLDLAKFLALLEHSALYFVRSDMLGDPYEGHDLYLARRLLDETKEGADPSEETLGLAIAAEAFRYIVHVSCWHQSPHESEAMWTQYASKERGIALRTTFRDLRDSFVGHDTIYVGEIQYFDLDKYLLKADNRLLPHVYKRLSFSHENETRAYLLHTPEGVEPFRQLDALRESPRGHYVKVDLATLVKEIVVSPLADNWFVEIVEAVARRYRLDAQVSKSRLDTPPQSLADIARAKGLRGFSMRS